MEGFVDAASVFSAVLQYSTRGICPPAESNVSDMDMMGMVHVNNSASTFSQKLVGTRHQLGRQGYILSTVQALYKKHS